MKKLPDGWKVVELKNLFDIKKGKKVDIADNSSNNAIPYIGIGNLRGVPISQYTSDNNGLLCEKEDILLVWDGANCGTVGSGLSGFVGSTIARLRLVDSSADTDYVFRFLKSKFEYFNSNTTGATIPHLDKKIVLYLKIPLPPLPTQKKIAAVLEKAEKLREWRKEADGLTDKFLKSTFLEMFGDPIENPKEWKVRKINDVIVDIEAGSCVIGEKRPRKENEFAVLMVSAVTKGIFLPNEHKVINGNQMLKKIVTPEKGDLLFSRANTYEFVGATCLIREDYPYLLLPDKLWKIKPNKSLLRSEYLKFVLSHAAVRKEISNNASGTSGSMLNISMSKLKLINIAIPPIELQQKFAKIVQQVEQIREHQTQSRQHIENLFNVLMQKAFNGELEA